MGIGILSENFPPFHYWVSVGFFLTFPFSMWFIGIGWLRFSNLRLFSLLSILLPFLSLYMWADVMLGTPIWTNVAIPEIVTALSAIVWLWMINMLHYQGKLEMIGEASESVE